VDRPLLGLDDDLVLTEHMGDPFPDLGRDALFVDAIIPHVGPEIVAGLVRLGRDRVDDPHADALAAIPVRCASPGRSHADIDRDRTGRLEVNDLPAIDIAGLAELRPPEGWR